MTLPGVLAVVALACASVTVVPERAQGVLVAATLAALTSATIVALRWRRATTPGRIALLVVVLVDVFVVYDAGVRRLLLA